MAGGVGKKGRYLGEINVVPLVDVMLVLLIIFMVTAPMMVQGVPVELPQTDSDSLKSDEDLLVVSVTRDGQVYLEEFPVPLDGLAPKLANIVSRKPKAQVYLRADKDVPYGIVVGVLAEAQKAGIKNLGMVTEPERVASPGKKKSS